ncbi:acetoin ABC transporter permease [Lactiplantibacillus pentosus]|uniref:acetoin ABC transporter permease n=1 Tax=Lactiplantibacillus pentosus TaxID=1589 RepID=UPI001C1F71BB|nr:acetoin ABC transporter permease [Lactiplantibacillus pentosus]MBU7502908.1 acetoin ABC transporter permease [Lactiplantibacillus pentosus]MDY1543281.1 acetoin ABC transporter permease [Lactiplantibacillus pentosus]
MTKRTLWQLLWRHYRVIVLTGIVALLLAGIKEGYSIVQRPSLYIAVNEISFTLTSANGIRMGLVVSILVSLVIGVVLFLNDNFTNFDQYLFSLPVPRRQIYRRKIGLLIGTVVSAYVLAEAIYGLITWRVLVNRHVGVNWVGSIYEEVEILALIITLSLVAATFGLWVGRVFASALATFVFTCSLPFAYDGLINIVAGVTGQTYRQADILGTLSSQHPSGLLIVLVICGVISGSLYWLNQWAFDHLSLENGQDFFRFPQLRGAVLSFSIGYLIIAISCSQFGAGIVGLLTDHYKPQLPLVTFILLTIAVAYLTWSLGRWFLYRPDRFRDAWTFKKLA